MTLAAPFQILFHLSLPPSLAPGSTLPSHLLGVLTDLTQVTGICSDLHPTPHLLVSAPSVSWSVTPWNRPLPASNPNLNLHVRLPIAPFQKSPWLALEPAGLTLTQKIHLPMPAVSWD